MGKRILSATVGVPLLVAAVVGSSLVFAGVVAVAAGIGAWEFYRLAHRGGARPVSGLGILFATLVAVAPEARQRLLGLALGWWGPVALSWLLPLALLLSWGALFLRKDQSPSTSSGQSPSTSSGQSQAAADWAWTMAGILYPGLLLSYWVQLRGVDPEGYLVLVGLLATFAADTGAFFVGRLWGRHPLAPQISPGKTWEGLVGGWVSAVAVAVLLTGWLIPFLLTPLEAVILGGLVGVMGPLGDLAESLLKRSVGAKDAGALIPGHGGVLDRLDSLLFTGPVIYFYYVSLLAIGGFRNA